MSDKSFGDHTNRGIVKNPLLSTAVIGLSIEDLTHNAVLLPVSRAQELVGRQEHVDNITPAPEITPSPSGDTSFTPIQPPQQNARNEDDFDVNEYFARLQGTRYVSAPINSHLDDIEAKEENLEEINLNEPVTTVNDVHQSITADIAQNFSQLPTVLPQVASAVFSSFSNMLSMKSREHTPEERQHAPAQGVPLMGVSERDVAPPPKEPPVTGPGNYRLTTKKKYAQIPGLTSGEPMQMPTYTPPTFNQPIFTPPQQPAANCTNVETNTSIPTQDIGQINVDSNVFNMPQNISETSHDRANDAPKDDSSNVATISQYGLAFSSQAAIIPPPPMFSNLAKQENQPNVGKAVLPPSVARRIGSNKPTITNQAPAFATFDNIFVPAPVTADTESSASTSAQSFISAAQTNPLATSFPSNYASEGPSQCNLSTPMPPRNVSSINIPPIDSLNKTTALFAPEISQVASSIAISNNMPSLPGVSPSNTQLTGNQPPPPTNIFAPPPSYGKMASITSHAVSASIPTPPQTFTSGSQSQLVAPPAMFNPGSQSQSASNMPLPANIPPYSTLVSVSTISTPAASIPPQIFNPYSQDQPSISGYKSDDSALTLTSQPSAAPQIINQHESILKTGITNTIPLAEPPKIPEPPKATGQTNFRMTRKRPQYYSGPIEGIGAMSNNVKPTLAPVTTTDFQGAVFTPEANTGYQPAVFAPENIASTSQCATFTPTAAENPNQSSMFTPLGINVNASSSHDKDGFNKPVENVHGSYNSALDLSHQATNTYEPPKQESASGIIGSLKSKLSSIDMNKLQNSVTTFFDPAYNSARTEAATEHDTQNLGIEIFVAKAETPAQPYNYDAHQASFTYGQGAIPNATDYYNQQIHNVYSNNSYYSEPSYGTESYSRTELQNQQAHGHNPNVNPDPTHRDCSSSQIDRVAIYQPNTGNVQDIVGNNSNNDNGTDNKNKVVELESPERFLGYERPNVENVEEQMEKLIETIESCTTRDESGAPIKQFLPLDPQDDLESHMVDSRGGVIINNAIDKKELEDAKQREKVERNATNYFNALNGIYDSNNSYHSESSSDTPSCSWTELANRQAHGQRTNINTDPTPVDFSAQIPRLHTYHPATGDVQDDIGNNNNNGDNNINVDEPEVLEPVEPYEKQLILPTVESMEDDVKKVATSYDSDECDRVSEQSNDRSWNTNEEEVDNKSITERLLTLGESSDDSQHLSDTAQGADLNICETCREVNQPEQKGPDLTTLLIENITAPVQLMNPVEVPLTETRSSEPIVSDDFDVINQGAEISLIADETVETLQVQSATELLDKNKNLEAETSYGWRTEAALPLGQDLLDHDYTFKTNPDSIGFFGNNNLLIDSIPKKDSDDINKTESEVSHNEPSIVLHRQMSIPTAPPAEDSDDTKSDDTGALDVQSIEQDASEDFPVFEEYVIEPSEADDDKIEFRDKRDENKDTFTNRVDRFKKLDGADQKDSGSSNTIMPSYFDTGNYAAEAHFKNPRSSPTISRIPPGFEDHYELLPDKKYEVKKVPDTSTQTSLTTTVTEARTKTENVTSTVSSNMTAAQEPLLQAQLPDLANVFGTRTYIKDTEVFATKKTIEAPAQEQTPINPQVKVEVKVQDTSSVPLPDPINFFASSSQSTDGPKREADDSEGVNRLASYFASPANTEHAKSFFELSLGQNHYRQNENTKTEDHKTFFELSQSQKHYQENISNIPTETFIANIKLMNDLTSCQNIEPSDEQILRTVNYFTVKYDNSDLNFNKDIPNFIEGETKEIKQLDLLKNKFEIEENITNNDDLTEVVSTCKFCCDITCSPVLTVRGVDFDSIGKVQFKQAMDTGGKPADGGVVPAAREEERTVGVRMEDLVEDGGNKEDVAMMTENRSSNEYEPVKHHWFYRVDCEDKSTWRGFSVSDSRAIENAFLSPDLNEGTLVPTDGGRYDVNVLGRLRISVYWTDKPTNVRRCSWFYKGTTDARYVPYTEAVAEKLEVEYRHGVTTGEWHRRLVLPNNELVVMHGPAVMVHFLQAGADAFGAPNLFSFGKRVYRNPPKFKVCHDLPPKIDHLLFLVHGAGEWRHQRDKIQSTMRPRVVRRGIDDSEIEDTEPSSIDHLLLLCHGVGSACDMRFRAVEEVVDDFRATSLQLLQSHYRNSYDSGIVGRVEVLPISWHAPLHSGPNGVDRRLARLTLASIPRLRNFTNDTVLDVLLYTSPHYCQMILDTVCGELNRIYTLFMKRNPEFKGQVSLGGHSLGSVILYDLLCNQPIPQAPSTPHSQKTYLNGSAANNPSFQYPRLCFEPLALYALGSPIAIFECIRGVESLGSEFRLPTCTNFFNIFHPYDPIAYRIEPLVNPQLQNVKPSLIPHHKGRKRMHLELKDTMARVGADLKQKLVESIKSTWSSMWSTAAPPDHQLEKVVEEEIEKEQLEAENSKEEPILTDITPGEMLGRLNGGRRIDYVLQEAPFEMINEYLFAMSSHVCYWESEDVMLLILREIYDSMNVQPDVTVPQQSMSVQRVTVVRDGEKVVVNSTDASTSRVT